MCLAFYVTNTIEPIKEELQGLQCFILFPKWLSWLLQPSLLSLTLNELFHFPDFSKYTHECLTYITRHNENTGVYGNIDSGGVRRIYKGERVNFESMPYRTIVTVIWFNNKGRIEFAVINQSPVREPQHHEWITIEMTEYDVAECIRHKGSYATTNVFFRIQSGRSNLTEEQREEHPYDFRQNTLMHKTTKYMEPEIPSGRDIHFVPTES